MTTNNTEDIIRRKCVEIEQENDINILFCVEGGSRAWKIDSKDSDYDIRFVYTRPLEEYLKINRRKEVIDNHYDKKGDKVQAEGCYLDFVGFDIQKFARMLISSNPQVIEWLISDILYYGNKNRLFERFALTQFKPISLYYHYKSMCRNNYLKYLKSKNLVTYKKYLYAMRGLLNAKWVATHNSVPPISFIKLIHSIKGIPYQILDVVSEIIRLKKEGKEKDIIRNIPRLDEYIESFLKDDTEAPANKRLSTSTELDKEVTKIIKEE